LKEKKPYLKRIKTFDLYDSEASNDGIVDESVEGNVDETIKEESKEEVIAVIKSLDALGSVHNLYNALTSISELKLSFSICSNVFVASVSLKFLLLCKM
jgi:hypothetical protein